MATPITKTAGQLRFEDDLAVPMPVICGGLFEEQDADPHTFTRSHLDGKTVSGVSLKRVKPREASGGTVAVSGPSGWTSDRMRFRVNGTQSPASAVLSVHARRQSGRRRAGNHPPPVRLRLRRVCHDAVVAAAGSGGPGAGAVTAHHL